MDDARTAAMHRLSQLPPELNAVASLAESLLDSTAEIDEHGVLRVARAPKKGAHAFRMTIYPPCSSFVLEHPFVGFKKEIPQAYHKVLLGMNGFHSDWLSLFGVLGGPSAAWKLDAANSPHGWWIGEYGRSVQNTLHIGSRSHGDDDIVGYFMEADGRVLACEESTGTQIAAWSDFATFLTHELAREPEDSSIDWLNEPDDPRDPSPPPSIAGDLARRLWKECPRLAEKALENLRPCLRLKAIAASDDTIPVGASKMGGAADLAEGAAWPTDSDGKPLHLIAQLNLADIGAFEIEPNLPSAGLLSFFYDADEMPVGLTPDEADGWRVILTPVDAPLRRLPEPARFEYRLRPCRVGAVRGVSLPDIWEVASTGLLGTPEKQRDAYVEIRESLMEGMDNIHQFLGCDSPVQHAVCEETVQAVSGCYEGGKFNKKRWESVESQVGEWMLLLQVDSDSAMDVLWGDVGAIYFTIRKEDLKAKLFDRAWLVFQCH